MTSRRPLALLFDLDDTLWPIAPVINAAEESWHAWLAVHAPRVAAAFSLAELRVRRMALLERRPELIADLYQLRREALAEVFAETGDDPAHIEGSMQHFAAQRNLVVPYADVLPVLPLLQGMLRLGVITNGNADLEVIGMDHHFEYQLSSSMFGRAKPDPEIFRSACTAMGVAPQDAVYVGDDLRLDVQGAQGAGLRAVWMNRHGSEAHLAAGVTPDAICATFDELLAWIRGQMQHSGA
ncbi:MULTISPECIES: HAD family hydrolase [unclassified Duganella]|uniref:HAD family hydrolase n=1 Tax=unclassified Duganella TaxID=2636909 RepID=UPI000881252B|nr:MULTISPECIES: HAD family hydrolase [unclassified Duganella]SDG16090.1 putative hydrolase of the HAD superfamily [Duganella sp. OV458]SDJ31862.1 putative hydrolase of the HAD superfamily [Duganella sp. OV510]